MNGQSVQIVKKLTSEFILKDYETVENVLSTNICNISSDNANISIPTLMAIFISLHFKENEDLANDLLIKLIPKLETKELIAVFKKITKYTDEFIQYCKKYVHIKELKQTISEIFKKLKIEQFDKYSIEAVTEFEKLLKITKLFETINTSEFKKTRNTIKPLIWRYSHLLPKLNEMGYRNLAILKATDIFLYDYSPIHPSETIRLQYFKKCHSFEAIFEFLKFNQIIENNLNRIQLIKEFEMKIDLIKNECKFNRLYPIYTDLLLNGIVLNMCRAVNPLRRHLGTGFLCHFIRHTLKDQNLSDFTYKEQLKSKFCNRISSTGNPGLGEIIIEVVNGLFYDLNQNIRDLVKDFSFLDNKSFEYHYSRLLSDDYPSVYGASICLSNTDQTFLLDQLRELFSTHDVPIYGIMNVLNNQKCISPMYVSLNNIIFVTNDLQSEDWRTIKECLVLEKNINNIEQLMESILYSNHFGLICFLDKLVDFIKDDEIDHYLKLGIDGILEIKQNIRKSGGMTVYFSKLLHNKDNYTKIKNSLCELICNIENNKISLKPQPLHVLINTLNVFIGLFDRLSYDYPFAFLLGFSCIEHPNFSIKNCGFTILANTMKKLLLSENSFDNFFNLNENLRSEIRNVLTNAIEVRNIQSLYFCLAIYSKTDTINSNELEVIKKCLNLDPFVNAKAEELLKIPKSLSLDNTSCTNNSEISKDLIYYPTSIENTLIYLNSLESLDNKEIVKKYKIKDSSKEYMIYQLVQVAKSKNKLKCVYNALNRYFAKTKVYCEIEDDSLGKVYAAEYDGQYLLEIINRA